MQRHDVDMTTWSARLVIQHEGAAAQKVAKTGQWRHGAMMNGPHAVQRKSCTRKNPRTQGFFEWTRVFGLMCTTRARVAQFRAMCIWIHTNVLENVLAR
jgi:hypothetical protein